MAMLPYSTQLVFDLSACCRKYFVLVVAAIALLMWLDGRVVSWIYKTKGRRMARAWFWGFTMLIITATAWAVLAMFIPKWRMGQL